MTPQVRADSYVSKTTLYSTNVAWQAAKRAHETTSAFIDDRAEEDRAGEAGRKMGWQQPKIPLMWHSFGHSQYAITPHHAAQATLVTGAK